MVQDVFEILLVLAQCYVLTALTSSQASVICTKEDGLESGKVS